MIRPSPTTGVRKGGIALAALIVLPAILLGFVVAMSARIYRDIHTRLQVEADAAALAGADSLANDAMLRGRLQSGGNSAELFSLLDYSRGQIRAYAFLNSVYGGYSSPDWNLTTPSQGDIIFGSYDRLQPTPFAPVAPQMAPNMPSNYLHTVNAVRVYIRRNEENDNQVPIPKMPFIGSGKVDASAVSTAMLDGDVQGFRPIFADRPVPLVPVAIDYNTLTTQTASFTDGLAYNPATQQFAAGQDQLPEITVTLTSPMPPPGVTTSAVILNIGHTAANEVAAQIATGVYAADLTGAPFNGAFLLQPDNSTSPPRLVLTTPGQQNFAQADGTTYETALNTIATTPYKGRLWPMYDGLDGSGQPIVIGFIAARLISAQAADDGMGNVQSIELKLQPTLVTEPSAVTDPAYRGYVGVPNLTIAKLRLVK